MFQTSTENMRKLPEIILLISWKGVKFVDAHSKVCYDGAVCMCVWRGRREGEGEGSKNSVRNGEGVWREGKERR